MLGGPPRDCRSRSSPGYYLAVGTYRFGLDPDNQSVPIITSVMDLAGVAVVLLVMTSSGVLRMDDHEPHTVKDLLVELKDASELMVDLAYAAVFFNDEKLADEVDRLDGRSGDLLRRLRTIAMLAARSPEDAEGMAGVLWIADAIQRIGDAAYDVARVVAARLGIPDALRHDLRHADEMTARVRVRDDAPAIGRDAPRAVAADRDRACG